MAVLATVGIALSFAQWSHGERASTCISDFLSYYTGGRLAFSGQIYSPAASISVRHEILGCSNDVYGQFVWPPYFAGLMWPLAQLPFRVALVVWHSFCVVAILGFVWLWPGPRWRTLAICSWSFPLMSAFVYGQDVPILLLAAGAGIVLLGKGCDFEAGLCLAVGAAKPHLFVILALLILVRRRWWAALGFGVGVGVEIGASFLTEGLGWPGEFWHAATSAAANPNPGTMINLHGLAYAFHAPWWIETILSLAFLALIAWTCMRIPDSMGFALALAGGVLLGVHSYLYDLTLVIPLVLTVLASNRIPLWLKWAAGVVASPALYWMPPASTLPGPVHFLLPAFLVLTGVAIAVGRREAEFAGGTLRMEG